jgi:hypothetical protein
MLEAEADGTIIGLANSISKTSSSGDKLDFIDTVRKYQKEYISRFPRPPELPPRGKNLQQAIDLILLEEGWNKTEQSGPDNPRPFGTSGTSDAGASAPPEASGGI